MYLDLDSAWESPPLDLRTLDARDWGPRIRCFAPRPLMSEFIRTVVRELPPFVLYGSGDFHHVSGALVGKSDASTVVIFDNHPDWDVRPPHWACGGWVNRAFDADRVQRVVVWGCGNFELNWPARMFGNRRVETFAWRERYPKRGQMTRGNWRAQFEAFSTSIRGPLYVSVDMDCLQDAVTNWESGLFTPDDVAWAIRQLPNVIAGDICGAYSPPAYARRRQRFAAEWDHPKLPPPDLAAARAVNTRAVSAIWPALMKS